MMLMLPTWPANEQVDSFTSRGHWAISSTLTTNHLLAIVALTNTLMSMNSAAFADGKLMRKPIARSDHSIEIIRFHFFFELSNPLG